MSILDDIGTHLTTNSVVGGATGWTLFKSYQPASPDKTITIYETGGPEPDQTPGTGHDFPTFQVRGRGTEFGYEALRTKMQEIFNTLNNASVSGYVYILALDSGPVSLGYDKDGNRPQLVWNFKAMKIRS